MLFNSFEFIRFFPIVLALYFIMPKKVRYIWLLIASYYFYMSWMPQYGLLLFGATAVTYGAGLLIDKAKKTGFKKLFLALSVVICFSLLFVFKYFMFAFSSLQMVAKLFGSSLTEPSFSLVLPVGISFFTFQAVGYVIDVYRGDVDAEKNFFRYALFVAFFPQLVAGPIERSRNLLKQIRGIENLRIWSFRQIQEGAVVMLYGYILKMIISDRAKIVVDAVFDPEVCSDYTGFIPAVATILFAIQIYCDFAGYTYIAIGASKIMGFDLMNNFNTPYLATSIRDFWARWHISLTQWFRDYLYIPLGGNRKGKFRKYLNIFIVFAVSGLWHGAAWHFVVWGVLHGILRIADDLTAPLRTKVYSKIGNIQSVSFRIYQTLGTFFFVCVAWVFFRAESIGQAFGMIGRTFTHWNPWVFTDGTMFSTGMEFKEWNVLFVALLFLLVCDICRLCKVDLKQKFLSQGWIFKSVVFVIGVMLVLVFGIYGADYDAASFIYFQF